MILNVVLNYLWLISFYVVAAFKCLVFIAAFRFDIELGEKMVLGEPIVGLGDWDVILKSVKIH